VGCGLVGHVVGLACGRKDDGPEPRTEQEISNEWNNLAQNGKGERPRRRWGGVPGADQGPWPTRGQKLACWRPRAEECWQWLQTREMRPQGSLPCLQASTCQVLPCKIISQAGLGESWQCPGDKGKWRVSVRRAALTPVEHFSPVHGIVVCSWVTR
jgi:hypothetical protein